LPGGRYYGLKPSDKLSFMVGIVRDRSAGYPIGFPALYPFGFRGRLVEWFVHSVLVDRAVVVIIITIMYVLV